MPAPSRIPRCSRYPITIRHSTTDHPRHTIVWSLIQAASCTKPRSLQASGLACRCYRLDVRGARAADEREGGMINRRRW
ncbi:unnamed protein product [Larinioides sclopetarius]|uniref:Ribosomal protein S14 n=1 Tax=Larinioides sclopetarius TaxID=280406 RepID=A0AAV2APV2_9ARAC